MRTWFITGAASGLGLELATVVAENNDHVIATSRSIEDLAALKEKFLDNITTLQLDVTDEQSIKRAVSQVDKVDIVVNNAGVGLVGAIEEIDLSDAKHLFDVNVWGVLRVTKTLLPILRRQQSGHIINISSVSGLFTVTGYGLYCASEHAVEAITDALAAELQEHNIHVTAVEPGAFRTAFRSNVVLAKEMEEYKNSVGNTRKFLEENSKNARGDPRKAAERIYAMSLLDEIPRRLPLGEDAWGWMQNRVKELEEQLLGNEDLTRGTDF